MQPVRCIKIHNLYFLQKVTQTSSKCPRLPTVAQQSCQAEVQGSFTGHIHSRSCLLCVIIYAKSRWKVQHSIFIMAQIFLQEDDDLSPWWPLGNQWRPFVTSAEPQKSQQPQLKAAFDWKLEPSERTALPAGLWENLHFIFWHEYKRISPFKKCNNVPFKWF